MVLRGKSAVCWCMAHVGEVTVMGLGQHAALFPLKPLTLTSFSACEAEFPLPGAVEMLCGAKRTWGTEGRRDIPLQT